MDSRRRRLHAVVALALAAGGAFCAAPAAAQDEDESDAEEASGVDESAVVDEEDEVRDSEGRWADRRASTGLGFDLGLGALATLRRMTFAGQNRTIEHRPAPYIGGALRGRQTLATWGERNQNFLVEVEGGYASAKNSEPEPGSAVLLVTEHTYGRATGVYESPLNPTLDLVLGLGVGATSFTVKPNPRYTGHRYIELVAHFGLTQWLEGPFRVAGGITFFPGLSTNQSAGGYGSVRSFGGRGELGGAWRFYQPDEGDMFGTAEVEARYSYTRYHSTYPETQALGDLPGSTDQSHAVVLLLNYSL